MAKEETPKENEKAKKPENADEYSGPLKRYD